MKDEALKLALEALEYHTAQTRPIQRTEAAINAIKQALANDALDKKAENARELGLDYEPNYKVTVVDDQHPNGVPLEQWGRPAPAPGYCKHCKQYTIEEPLPAAQPAVPDAITDRSESPEYIQGWNDCRAEMLKGMKP